MHEDLFTIIQTNIRHPNESILQTERYPVLAHDLLSLGNAGTWKSVSLEPPHPFSPLSPSLCSSDACVGREEIYSSWVYFWLTGRLQTEALESPKRTIGLCIDSVAPTSSLQLKLCQLITQVLKRLQKHSPLSAQYLRIAWRYLQCNACFVIQVSFLFGEHYEYFSHYHWS